MRLSRTRGQAPAFRLVNLDNTPVMTARKQEAQTQGSFFKLISDTVPPMGHFSLDGIFFRITYAHSDVLIVKLKDFLNESRVITNQKK